MTCSERDTGKGAGVSAGAGTGAGTAVIAGAMGRYWVCFTVCVESSGSVLIARAVSDYVKGQRCDSIHRQVLRTSLTGFLAGKGRMGRFIAAGGRPTLRRE